MATAFEFRQGIYWLRRRFGGGGTGSPVTPCDLLLLNGDTFAFLDGNDFALLGCLPASDAFLLLNGDDFALLNGDTFALLSG